ncbi:YbjN domain-containing protein [Pendulispora rubella]|uniref:YbjN domain-containing protein n=1 Tax=Pendulispora rubella TaxID=2741070 RepID=A0ABZ2L199_9BACT
MRTIKDVEAYLEKLNRRYSVVEGERDTYLIPTSEAFPPIVMRIDPPLVVLRVHIGDAAGDPPPLFRKLLELNAGSLLHSSYGLEADRIVLAAALELENLDFNELEATLDEIDVALAQQVPELAHISKRQPVT